MRLKFPNLFLALMLISVLMLPGCAGLQINDNATTDALAYVSGKGMGFGINKLFPAMDAELSAAWVDMMSAAAGGEQIGSEQMLKFYNRCIGIISRRTSDPYGLIGDLATLLLIYGAQYDAAGVMVAIRPVPMPVLKFFEMGYDSGRRVARDKYAAPG